MAERTERKSAESEPVVYAQWVNLGRHTFACDNCGVRFGRVSRRCPYCGAHMDTSDRESR